MYYKICSRCKKTLPDKDFYRHLPAKDGLFSQCKNCKKKLTSERIEKFGRLALTPEQKHNKKEWWKSYYEKKKAYILSKHKVKRKLGLYKNDWKKRSKPYLVSQNMKCAVGRVLKGQKKFRRWEDLVGYKKEELLSHLESRFRPGMTWENYGKWHIDHIRPISSFSFNNTEDLQFKKCWALSNLQPLWAQENLRKHAKWPL